MQQVLELCVFLLGRECYKVDGRIVQVVIIEGRKIQANGVNIRLSRGSYKACWSDIA